MRLEFRAHNRIELLRRGSEYFPRLIEAIAAARTEVLLESYLYEDDPTGRAVSLALCAAARRGVAVHLTLDGFGARHLAPEFVRQFADSGVRLVFFRPLRFAWPRLELSGLRRMHRKLAVIDGALAFVGGFNVIDDLNTHEPMPARLDYAVRISGPLVADCALAARRLWSYAAGLWLTGRWEWPAAAPPPPAAGSTRAALAVRDNLRHRHAIARAYLGAIGHARSEIVLASAYFWPGHKMLRALCMAAARGVKVTILMQGRPDHPLLYHATRSLYDRLLKAGIDVLEYRKSHLHAKVAVIDGRWATVGSSNIDPFSLLLAREANVVIEDREFSGALKASLEQEIRDGGERVEPSHRRGWAERIRIRCSYLIVRAIAYSVGFRS